jgi:hypothetical protein
MTAVDRIGIQNNEIALPLDEAVRTGLAWSRRGRQGIPGRSGPEASRQRDRRRLRKTRRHALQHHRGHRSCRQRRWSLHKIHPVLTRTESDLTPGERDQNPVTLDIGRVGIQTCLDVNWPADWQRLVDAGAELVVFISAMAGGHALNTLARLTHTPVVSTAHGECCWVIDRLGRCVGEARREARWAAATLDLESAVFHMDKQRSKLDAIRDKYGPKLKIETLPDEALFMLESAADDLSVADVVREFNLLSLKQYLRRSDEAKALAFTPPTG